MNVRLVEAKNKKQVVKKKYLTPMKICYMIAQVISDGRDFKADIII